MDYQVIVIGSGPGGYVAAIRCAQLGFKTAIVEKYKTLGGTCLNVGCIPSKALLDSSEHFDNALHHFKEHGITINTPKVNFGQMIGRKNDVVKQNVEGIAYLMKKNKIEVLTGTGSFKDNHTVIVTEGKEKAREITGEKIIIATGSKPTALPFAPFDKKRIISSTEALSLNEIPKHLIVIGGGVIGMELGSVYKRIGAEVTVIEFLDNIIPTMDTTLSNELLKTTKKMGMSFYLGHKVSSITAKGKEVIVKAESKEGKTIEVKGDYCLVAVGRKPYTEGLGLEKAGVKIKPNGQVETDDHLKTTAENIYAIGDVVAGPMLAHKAEEEGVFVAEHLA
ncbi:MAG: dihydrolipoyl dehydrogenase, partial [Cyclobacteriaceae bacterium]|nr:dihydrolipoyl dehydrogenase [Cyclobacteriaceae bacterium]